MLAILVSFLVVYARWAPTTWLGRSLNELTERACRQLASIRLLTIICFIVFVAVLAALVAYGRFDGLVVAAQALPEGFATFFMFDVGTAMEVLVMTWLATARGKLSAAAYLLRLVRRVLGQIVRVRSAGRAHRSRRRPAKSGDEDSTSAWLPPMALAA